MQTPEYKSGRGQELRFQELKTIAEWIVDIETFSPGESIIFNNFDLVVLQTGAQGHHIEDADGRVRFGRRSEINVHPDVQLMHATLQPDAAPRLQGGWFCEFRHAKYFDVKLAGCGLAARRRGELNMVDAEV